MNDTRPAAPARRAGAPAATATSTIGGWTVTRARYAMMRDALVPGIANTYVLPFGGPPVYNDGDVTMNEDNTLTVNTKGLYRASISGIWQDRADGQVDLRIIGFGHGAHGEKPGTYVPGQLTKITARFDRLIQYDVTSSNTTRTSRYQGIWKPGAIAKGQVVSIDVRLARTGVVNIGDIAYASHTGITDDSFGMKETAALIVSAKVVGPDTVRVSIYNPTITVGVTVPQGQLEVVAMSAVTTTGSSGQGQMLASSSLESLKPGDCIYGYFRSQANGDLLRATPSTFLQIERWA